MGRKTAILLLVTFSLPGQHAAWDGRIGHDTGYANATKPALSETLWFAHAEPSWRYGIFTRRDELIADRNLLNAVAIASGGLHFGNDSLYLGLGTHFRRVQLDGQSGQANFSPAAGLYWQSHRFNLEILGAEKLTRVQGSLLIHFAFPLELLSIFEYVESQPYRWSVDASAHIARHGGLIGGFEPSTSVARAGLWLTPLENLSLRALSRVPLKGEVYFEFSLAYAWNDIPATGPSVRIEESPPAPLKVKTETKVPAFATLVKWGLTPVAALKLTREKNICAIDQGSRAILARHHWECHGAK